MKFLCIALLIAAPFFGHAQIVSKQNPKKKAERASGTDTSGLSIYFHYGYGSSFRVLKPAKSAFGKELGERANETPIGVSSFQFGINSKISKTLSWDFGIQWVQFGEQYNQRFEDSLSMYTAKYSSLAVPIRVQMEFGKRLTFFCATGIQAQFLSLYRKESTIDVAGKTSESTEKTLKNANSFLLASTSSMGIKYPLRNNIKILLGTEFVFQLSNTFTKQSPYSHYPYYIQGKLGIQWSL